MQRVVYGLLLLLCSFFFSQKRGYETSGCLVGSEMCILDSSYPDELQQFAEISSSNVKEVLADKCVQQHMELLK